MSATNQCGTKPLPEGMTSLKSSPAAPRPIVPVEHATDATSSTFASAEVVTIATATFGKLLDQFGAVERKFTNHISDVTDRLEDLEKLTVAEKYRQQCKLAELTAQNDKLRVLLNNERNAKAPTALENQRLRTEMDTLRRLIPPPDSKLSETLQLARLRQRIAEDTANVTQIIATLELESRIAQEMRQIVPRVDDRPLTAWEVD